MEKKKLLVIDDEEDFSYFVKLNLEKTKEFEVLTTSDGEEGIKLAQKTHPDLILLDILMPKMSGSDVADALVNNPATKDIPIIFLTALVRKEEEKENEGEIGGRRFISKPVSVSELISRIKMALLPG
ncbi:MAG: response regulator [Candidatus Omnitrophica bacterium]|nr:response regulator [Candidatus Omnitrophota bacterium]